MLFGPSNPDDGFVEGQHPVASLAVLYSSDGLKPDDGFVEGQHPVAALAVLYSSATVEIMIEKIKLLVLAPTLLLTTIVALGQDVEIKRLSTSSRTSQLFNYPLLGLLMSGANIIGWTSHYRIRSKVRLRHPIRKRLCLNWFR